MPNSQYFTVGGTVQAGSGLYLPRSVDEELLDLCTRREFAFVLTARQMGKSSLMVRTAQSLAEAGTRSVIIDLSQIGVMVDVDAWYLGLLTVLEEALELDADPFEWWEKHKELGHAQRFTRFLTDIVLDEVKEPVVIFIDEIDTTLSLDFTDDFFAAIRFVYNARARTPDLERISFVLIGVATPSDLISDPSRTPFNIGRRVDVDYFTLKEAQALADGFPWPADRSGQVLRWIFDWTDGHPYLTQRLCQAVALHEGSDITKAMVDKVVGDAFFGERSDEDNNIRFVNDMITVRSPEPLAVLETYRRVRRGKAVADDRQSSTITHLKLAGIVVSRQGKLQVRNRIYATIFDAAWIARHWPESWVERIPVAIKGLVAALVIALLAMGLALYQSSKRQDAEQQFSEDMRISNERLVGQIAVADSLTLVTAQANEDLSVQFALADSLRQIESLSNLRLQVEINRSDSLAAATVSQNTELNAQFAVADSLRLESEAANASLLGIAEDLTVEAAEARQQTVTLALATTAVRQIRLGDPVLGALLARQAYLLGSGSEDEFLEPVHDALVQSLNAVSGDERAGGPQVMSSLDASARAIAYSPDGTLSVAALENGEVVVNSGAGGAGTTLFRAPSAVRAVAWSPDGSRIASASDDGWVRLAAADGSESPTDIIRHEGGAWALAFNGEGSRLATAGADGMLNIVDSATGAVIATATPIPGVRIRDVAFLGDGQTVVCALEDGSAWQGLPGGSEPGISWEADEGRLLAVAVSPDGGTIATGGDSGFVRLWTPAASAPGEIAELRANESSINTLTFSSDGRYLAAGSADHGIAMWFVNRLEALPFVFREHTAWVLDVAFSRDDAQLTSSAADKTLRTWTIDTSLLAEAACGVVAGREITEQEWRRYVGEDIQYSQYRRCEATSGATP